MDGVFVFWFGWMFWIVVHFFWEKTRRRFLTSFFLLFFLSTISYTYDWNGLAMSVAFLPFVFYLCAVIRRYSVLKLTGYLLMSWAIGAAYSAFQLMIIFDPVIVLLDERLLSAALVSILPIFLMKSLKERFHLAVFGLVQGELVVALAKNHFLYAQHVLGSLSFYDKVAFVGLIYGSCACFIMLKLKMKKIIAEAPPLERSS